ncbi:MAG: hypothetical protein OHK0022_24830 [Roseiflexaceae bacterium]
MGAVVPPLEAVGAVVVGVLLPQAASSSAVIAISPSIFAQRVACAMKVLPFFPDYNVTTDTGWIVRPASFGNPARPNAEGLAWAAHLWRMIKQHPGRHGCAAHGAGCGCLRAWFGQTVDWTERASVATFYAKAPQLARLCDGCPSPPFAVQYYVST